MRDEATQELILQAAIDEAVLMQMQFKEGFDGSNSGEKALAFSNLSSKRETSLVAFILILILGVTLRSPRFFSLANFHDILLDSAIVAIASIGQMMVVMTGGIDLSVGSGLALSGMLVGLIYKGGFALNPYLALLIGGLIGLGLGSINSLLVVKGNIPPIIATLGTMSIYRGMIFLASEGQWVSAHEMPSSFIRLARGTILGIPNLIFIAGVLYIIFYFFLSHAKTGREVYAVGGNLQAARVAGINTDKINYIVYSATGFLYGSVECCGFRALHRPSLILQLALNFPQ